MINININIGNIILAVVTLYSAVKAKDSEIALALLRLVNLLSDNSQRDLESPTSTDTEEV